MKYTVKDFLFISLEDASSKPFEGLTVGEFTDSWGRDVAWSPTDIAAIAMETKLALQARKISEGDDFAGLPIEGTGHYSGNAVGWITDIDLSGDGQTILFTPEWTEEGVEIINSKKRRYFSPTIAQRKDGGTILGGTLTNWPAIRDGQDLPLMRPVALTDGRFTFGAPDDDADDINPNLLVQIRDSLSSLTQKLTPATPREKNTQEGEKNMKPKDLQKMLDKLSPEEKAETLTSLILESGGDVADLVSEEIEKSLKEVDSRVAKKVSVRVEAELAKRETIAYAKELVGGDDAGKGLPADGEEMEEFLVSLDDTQLEKAKSIFSAVLKTGVIDFAEKGHEGKKPEGGRKTLSVPMGKVLAQNIEQGISIEKFFETNPDLGKPSEYDLKEFEVEKK